MNSPLDDPPQNFKVEIEGRSFYINPKKPLPMLIRPRTERKDGMKYKTEKKQLKMEAKVRILPIDEFEKCGFELPAEYIRFDRGEIDSERQDEYDVDREDLIWLDFANAKRKQNEQNLITKAAFEQAIYILENESHFQSSKHGDQAIAQFPLIDNDAPCCICNDGEDTNANQIIFCDMCNIAVHQDCYGVPFIPEGQWLCRRCELSPSSQVQCVLCPFTSGAFKQTADGRWVHVFCAIYLSEVHFANVVFLEPVEGVDFSLKRRSRLNCLVCKRKKVGACLQCSSKNCTRSFHVTCAFFSGMRMVIKEEKSKSNDNVTINRYVFCHQHSQSGSEIKNVAAWKKTVDDKIRNARRLLHNTVKEKPEVSIPVVSKETLTKITAKLKLDFIDDIYYFWLWKRKSRFGVPLVRRFQVYHTHKILAGSSLLPDAIHPRKEIQDGRSQLIQMRSILERVRLLCELVKKREKQKKELIQVTESVISATLRPLPIIMRDTLRKLIEKDHMKVFTQPVNEEEVPGYSSIIKNPMDFQKMMQKLVDQEYKQITDLKADFDLMMSNCAFFNRNNHHFYKYGYRIKQIGSRIIKQAEAETAMPSTVLSNLLEEIGRLDVMGKTTISEAECSFSGSGNRKKLRQHDKLKKLNGRVRGTNNETTSHDSASLIEKKESPSSPKVKSLTGPSRKRKLNATASIKDYFPPLHKEMESASTHLFLGPKQAQASTSPQRKIISNIDNHDLLNVRLNPRKKSVLDYTTTEISSASETMTSMDELDTVTSKPHRREKIPPHIGNTPKLSPNKRSNVFSSAAAKFFTTTNNEFEAGNPMTFEHDDIVWAPVNGESNKSLPARVIDLLYHQLDLDDFPVAKAIKERPKDSSDKYSLVIFFDLLNSWKWIHKEQLKLCKIWMSQQPTQDKEIDEALTRAKKFWKSIMDGNIE